LRAGGGAGGGLGQGGRSRGSARGSTPRRCAACYIAESSVIGVTKVPNHDSKSRWVHIGEGDELANLGDVDAEAAKHKIDLCEQAVATARENGNRREELAALIDLGDACCFSLGQFKRAIEHYEQALTISRELGDRREEAQVLDHLGWAYTLQKEPTRAFQHYVQTLAIYHEIDDRSGAAKQLSTLGSFLITYGSPEQRTSAIEHYQLALSIYQEIGDRKHEATVLGQMGGPYLLSGERERAFQCQTQALSIAREIDERSIEANALHNLGTFYGLVGQKDRAIECYQQALSIYREIDDHTYDTMILTAMGSAYSELGRVDKAIEITQAAAQTGGLGADRAREQLNRLYTRRKEPYAVFILPVVFLVIVISIAVFMCISAVTPVPLHIVAISIGGIILVTLVAIFGLFNSSIIAKLPATERNRYVSIEELCRNAPTDLTEQEGWKQWKNKYMGKHVRGKGQFSSASIHPEEGKLFFIVTISGEEGTIENNATQVAFLIEDVRTIDFGKKEGSFLINNARWIYLGENYAFEGKVSGFSSFDTELVSLGRSDLVIVKGKTMDIS